MRPHLTLGRTRLSRRLRDVRWGRMRTSYGTHTDTPHAWRVAQMRKPRRDLADGARTGRVRSGDGRSTSWTAAAPAVACCASANGRWVRTRPFGDLAGLGSR